MVLRLGLFSPRGGLLTNILWLVFALSFLWFPYIGMLTFPCQRDSRTYKHRSNSWSKRSPAALVEALDYTDIMPLSTANSSISIVMQDQKKRLQSFCAAHNMPTTVYSAAQVRDLYHHLLVDDKRKILFCYIPKVGCSNWKRVFLILAGLVDQDQKSRPSEEIFRQVNSLESYSPKEIQYRLRNYFKFMFIRYPPERVLSAYRNKIEHPLVMDPDEQNLWDGVRYTILSSYRLSFNNKIAKEEDEVLPTFSEYLHFLLDSDPVQMNEHYKPMAELCQPCALNYDFVGNFGSMRADADALLDHLNINSSLFWDRGKRNQPTNSYIRKYYSKLNPIDFRRLEERFGPDIGLYNHLFPNTGDPNYSLLRESKL